MKTFSRIIFLLLLTITIAGQEIEQFRYWNNGVGIANRWVIGNMPESEIVEVKKRWDEIGESLKTTTNPFAGTYFQSGNRGYYLRWSPEKGFVYVYYYEYFVLDASFGKIVIEDSVIEFIPEREMTYSRSNYSLKTPLSWVPAFKGKYFVKKEAVKSFGDFYAGFGEFNGFPRKWNCDCGPFAERADKNVDYDKNAAYILPDKYSSAILKPISGRIATVGKKYLSWRPVSENSGELASVTPVTLNVGQTRGVKAGLMFFLEPDFEGLHQIIKVLRIGKRSSSAIVIREIDENKNENYPDWNDNSIKPRRIRYPQIQVGSRVTTRSVDSL